MLRMDEFNKIRKEFHVNKKSIYQIAKEYRRSWATVKSIVIIPEHKIPLRGKRDNRLPIVVTPEVENKIIEYLDHEVTNKVPKKQRFTAAFIYSELKSDGLYAGSSKTIRTIVARLRKERKQIKSESYLALDFEPGKYLQVDHGPVEVEIDSVRIPGNLFVAAVPGQSLRFCQFYPTKAQEAWGEFHESAFNFFGGIFPNVVYDNDSVLKINKTGEETSFCTELQIHYGFKAIFCNKAAGWEKGAVENAVGFCRRNFLAGVQCFESFTELNKYLETKSLDYILHNKHYITKKDLANYYDDLKPKLNETIFKKDWGRWEDLQVDKFQTIKYQDRKYSVPEKYIGTELSVFITAQRIDIYDNEHLIFSHERLYLAKHESFELDHYLDQLLRKPTAVRHAKVIKNHDFHESVLILKDRLDLKYDDKIAAKDFIKILQLRRASTADEFISAIKLSLEYNAISFQGVQSLLNHLQTDQSIPIIDTLFKTIDNQFSLDKYGDLENAEVTYD